MLITLDRKGTVEGLQYLLEQAAADEATSGALVLACEDNGFIPEAINDYLIQYSKPVFGGIFSGIMFDQEKLQKGTIVAGVHKPVSTVTIDGIGDIKDMDGFLAETFETRSLQDKTMFVFVDGLSEHISLLIESMLNCYGLLPNYIGGGAGSLIDKKPCVITNEGLLDNAAVFALTDMRSGIGVAHGWKPVAGPLKVTEADRHTVISLNWRPAFEAYREVVEKLSGEAFYDNEFFELAKGFPFGIVKMAKEMVVRDPLEVDGNKIVCVGEIPVNSLVYILEGNKDSLISGVNDACRSALESYRQAAGGRTEKPLTTIFMDCVSRVLFLQSDFTLELEAAQMGHPLLGALTLGEIANTGKSYLEFYNKTSVIGLLED